MAEEVLHCLASPSYLKQVLLCKKSLPKDPLALEDDNEQAVAGTIQHALLNYKLSKHFGLKTEEVDTSSLTNEELDEVEEVYQKALGEYQYLKRKYARVEVLLEEKVSLDNYLPNPSWGYVDIAYVGHRAKPNKDGIYNNSTIYVLDAKFGRIKVDVIDETDKYFNLNPQLCSYWCGVYDLFKDKYEITRGIFAILQPKIHNYPTFITSKESILDYMNRVISPAVYEAVNDEGSYNPRLENCKYCKNKIHCKYNNAQSIALMQLVDEPDMLDDSVIEDLILPHINGLKKYCDSILSYCIKRAEEGKKWKGFTLSTGRPTRVYTDEDEVKRYVETNHIDGVLVETLLTPAQAEKALGKEAFASLLGDLVTYKPGKNTLVADAPVKKASKKELKNEFKGE